MKYCSFHGGYERMLTTLTAIIIEKAIAKDLLPSFQCRLGRNLDEFWHQLWRSFKDNRMWNIKINTKNYMFSSLPSHYKVQITKFYSYSFK
jgi:predicted nucleotidyltransferase component of viral defense system